MPKSAHHTALRTDMATAILQPTNYASKSTCSPCRPRPCLPEAAPFVVLQTGASSSRATSTLPSRLGSTWDPKERLPVSYRSDKIGPIGRGPQFWHNSAEHRLSLVP